MTHGIHWLPKVDRIIVLTNGSITEAGTYEELLDHAGPFAEFLTSYLKEHNETEDEDPEGRGFVNWNYMMFHIIIFLLLICKENVIWLIE